MDGELVGESPVTATVMGGAIDVLVPPRGTALPGTPGGRRVYAWADPDAVANGYSGPNNSLGSRVAKLNNNPRPIGGPAECLWSVNNCGPNDEPFGFHPGGVNSTFGDGSVRTVAQQIDAKTLRALLSRDGGEVLGAP
jgi:prepilin-type processing-associated H-X9-DG protein